SRYASELACMVPPSVDRDLTLRQVPTFLIWGQSRTLSNAARRIFRASVGMMRGVTARGLGPGASGEAGGAYSVGAARDQWSLDDQACVVREPSGPTPIALKIGSGFVLPFSWIGS